MVIINFKFSKQWLWFPLLFAMFLLFSWQYRYLINGSSIDMSSIFFPASGNQCDPKHSSRSAVLSPVSSQNVRDSSRVDNATYVDGTIGSWSLVATRMENNGNDSRSGEKSDPEHLLKSTLLGTVTSQNVSDSSRVDNTTYAYNTTYGDGMLGDKLNPLPVVIMTENNGTGSRIREKDDPCAGRYIYIHDLPSQFNDNLIKDCRNLGAWIDFCPFVKNHGLGSQVEASEGVVSNTSWYKTDQFMLSAIFYDRMKRYECLTKNSSIATAVHVPFYAGLEVGRHLYGDNKTVRDAAALDLVQWLREKKEWKACHGNDHFIVAGRICWDLRRDENGVDWGSKLLKLPELKNMTVLTIESSPWDSNDFAIPYPTYFHPLKDNELLSWQETVRRQKRRYFFTFQGAPRPNMNNSIRSELISQCLASKGKCHFVNCTISTLCNDPVHVMRNFKDSVFCLQPPGDSPTRRSAFDSILAGCIPVFFHPGSAYTQYIWHFPKNYTKYSVFIPMDDVKKRNASVEKVLARIPKEHVLEMREEVIRLIPKITYSRTKLKAIDDAFDVTIKRVLERVKAARKTVNEGKDPRDEFSEYLSWKYFLTGTTLGKHEWDSFF